MADRGFEIQGDLANLGVKLNIPPFLKGKGQFEEGELVETRRIAVIMWNGLLSALKITIYWIMCQSLYVIQVLLIKSFFVCAMLTNFLPPLVSDEAQ